MTPDEQHCVGRLEWHEDRLSKLLQLLGGAKFVVGRDDDVLQGFYREIKRDLKDEYEAGKTKAAALSQPERVWLQPPPQGASKRRTTQGTPRITRPDISTDCGAD